MCFVFCVVEGMRARCKPHFVADLIDFPLMRNKLCRFAANSKCVVLMVDATAPHAQYDQIICKKKIAASMVA